MAKHERKRQKKQDKEDQKHLAVKQKPQPLFDQFHAWGKGIANTKTPFLPRMDEHAELLTMAPSDEHRANLVLHLQRTYGNRYVQRLLNSRVVQAKLNVSSPSDVYEQEADRVAKAVTRAAKTEVQRQAVEEEEEPLQGKASQVQRQEEEEPEEEEEPVQPKIQLAAEEEEEVQAKAYQVQRQAVEEEPEEEEEEPVQPKIQLAAEEEEEIQTQPAGSQPTTVSENLETRIKAERGGGHPLSDDAREPMEHAFGADFSGVRVHTGSEADALNQQLSAKAFTTGQDIFFRENEYSPGSDSGRELIAHELTHVVQQTGGQVVQRDLSEDDLRKLSITKEQYEQFSPGDKKSIEGLLSAGNVAGARDVAEEAMKTLKSRTAPVPPTRTGYSKPLPKPKPKPTGSYKKPLPVPPVKAAEGVYKPVTYSFRPFEKSKGQDEKLELAKNKLMPKQAYELFPTVNEGSFEYVAQYFYQEIFQVDRKKCQDFYWRIWNLQVTDNEAIRSYKEPDDGEKKRFLDDVMEVAIEKTEDALKKVGDWKMDQKIFWHGTSTGPQTVLAPVEKEGWGGLRAPIEWDKKYAPDKKWNPMKQKMQNIPYIRKGQMDNDLASTVSMGLKPGASIKFPQAEQKNTKLVKPPQPGYSLQMSAYIYAVNIEAGVFPTYLLQEGATYAEAVTSTIPPEKFLGCWAVSRWHRSLENGIPDPNDFIFTVEEGKPLNGKQKLFDKADTELRQYATGTYTHFDPSHAMK